MLSEVTIAVKHFFGGRERAEVSAAHPTCVTTATRQCATRQSRSLQVSALVRDRYIDARINALTTMYFEIGVACDSRVTEGADREVGVIELWR